jgi:hypothetical protein
MHGLRRSPRARIAVRQWLKTQARLGPLNPVSMSSIPMISVGSLCGTAGDDATLTNETKCIHRTLYARTNAPATTV